MAKFDDLPIEAQDFITWLKAHYHYRDTKQYLDGSIGTIEISPKQLNEILAEAYIAGCNNDDHK